MLEKSRRPGRHVTRLESKALWVATKYDRALLRRPRLWAYLTALLDRVWHARNQRSRRGTTEWRQDNLLDSRGKEFEDWGLEGQDSRPASVDLLLMVNDWWQGLGYHISLRVLHIDTRRA